MDNLRVERELFEVLVIAEYEKEGELTPLQKRDLVRRDKSGRYEYGRVPGMWDGWLMARRATPASAQQGDELPPLPDPDGAAEIPVEGSSIEVRCVDAWSRPIVEQAMREYGAAFRAGAGDAAEDARDAARYRWLRNTNSWGNAIYEAIGYGNGCDFDKAIDAARAAHPGGAAEGTED